MHNDLNYFQYMNHINYIINNYYYILICLATFSIMSQQQILYIAVLVCLISYQNKSNQYFMSIYVFIFHLCQYYTINPPAAC